MEASSSLILTNQTYQSGPVNQDYEAKGLIKTLLGFMQICLTER